MGVIYLRTNRINGKKYVGQATDLKVRQRDWNNLNQPYAGQFINNARAKYGLSAFGFEILKECSDDELDYWETYFIEKLNTKSPNGYNLTEGGGGCKGYHHTEESRRKISETHKGKETWMKGKHHNEESRRKISEKAKGRHYTEEAKKKMSEIRKGIRFSEEHRKKISEALKGKERSEEHRKNLSKALKGKKLSEDTIIKMAEGHRGKYNTKKSKTVFQYDLEGNFIAKFPSTNEVERLLGFDSGNVSKCCRGEKAKAYGYKWKYA